VSTAAYFPYCFFNLLSPLLDILYGFLGFKVPSREIPVTAEQVAVEAQPQLETKAPAAG
jgi:Na+:H+ antiporter, NhaC family